MNLTTIIATVELSPASDIALIKRDLLRVLTTHGVHLPENQWVPDTETLTDAYDAEHMHVEILNP